MADFLSMMKNEFKIVRLGEVDARGMTDHILVLRELILAHDPTYPGIGKWYRDKVYPGLIENNRAAFVGYFNERPAASAIIKNCERSKICHIHIKNEFRNLHIGELFFVLMALHVRTIAKNLHITMPENLWHEKNEFFKSFGFLSAKNHLVQYRADLEIVTSVDYDDFWRSAIDKFPKLCDSFSIGGYTLGDGLLFSIKPRWAHKIIDGKKKVELRKKFDKKWEGKTIGIYSSSPEQCIIGEAHIEFVDSGDPEYIWHKYNDAAGCSRIDFDDYVGDSDRISAIVLGEVRPYKEPIPLIQLEMLTRKNLIPPQSYCTLKNNKNWSEAVSIAAMLQSGLNNAKPLIVGV